jgi:hypothetical protein
MTEARRLRLCFGFSASTDPIRRKAGKHEINECRFCYDRHGSFERHRPSEPSPGNPFEPVPEFDAVHGGWQEREQNAQGARRVMALLAGAGAMLYLIFGKRPAMPAHRESRALRAV